MKKVLFLVFAIMLSMNTVVLAESDQNNTETNTEEGTTVEQNQETENDGQAEPSVNTENQNGETTTEAGQNGETTSEAGQNGETTTETDQNESNIDLSEHIEQPEQQEKSNTMDYVWIGVFLVILLVLLILYFKDRE